MIILRDWEFRGSAHALENADSPRAVEWGGVDQSLPPSPHSLEASLGASLDRSVRPRNLCPMSHVSKLISKLLLCISPTRYQPSTVKSKISAVQDLGEKKRAVPIRGIYTT